MMMLNPTSYLKSGYTNSNGIISSGSQQLYAQMGSYYNGTTGCQPTNITVNTSFNCTRVDFTQTGLKNDMTRNAIEEVVWNLGGSSTYSNVITKTFYSSERGNVAYSGHATKWLGKVGMIYPSDYGYATSGGTTGRSACLTKELYNWNASGFTDCENNNYLFKSGKWYWTLTSNNELASSVFRVGPTGFVGRYRAQVAGGTYPTVYLKTDISVGMGDGSQQNPYQLEIK